MLTAISVTPDVAARIMGRNFHGLEVAERHFVPFTAEERAARTEIPFSEETLRASAQNFILLATHPLSLPAIHEKHKECFWNDPDALWFGKPQEREKWSDQPITIPWLLVRKDVVPDSWSKGYWVRFPVQTADGDWVGAYWDGGQLGVNDLYGGAGGAVGSCTVRTS